MSILRGLAVFLISSLFTFTLFMSVTSYTFGDLTQKENLKTFVKSELVPILLEQECENYCLNFTREQKQSCTQICVNELSNKTEETVNKAVDEVYEKEFYNISINDVVSFLNQFILFAVLALISGALILIVSKTPLITLGKNLISVSVSLFIVGFSPNLVMAISKIPIVEMFSDYLVQGLNQQIYFAIIFIVVGILLIIINYVIKRRKKVIKGRKRKKK